MNELVMAQVYTWGRGEDGQLGLGDHNDQYMPRLIEALDGKDIVAISCGSGHSLTLTSEGAILSWGRGDDGRLGHGDQGWKYEPNLVSAIKTKRIVFITCGSYHTAAVTHEGELYTWGGGMYGKLGHGNENGCSVPKKVDSLKESFVMQVACGSRHSVALVWNNDTQLAGLEPSGSFHGCPAAHYSDYVGTSVYSWGDRENGVSGLGEMDGHQYFPALLKNLEEKNICQITACGFHTAAVSSFGEVYTWGEGKFGRLGHGKEFNQKEPLMIDYEPFKNCHVVEVSCGGFHTAAITKDGELFTFGGGEHGQLGQGNKENYSRPKLVEALKNVKQVSCGWSHTVALAEDGSVWTFGNGDHGKLGLGDTKKEVLPKRVEGLASKRVLRVASYNEHTAALAVPLEGSANLPNSMLLEEFASMVNNSEFADVCFILEDERRVYAHRAILAARSAHFRAMFTSGMKESREKEIKISDTRHDVFLALMYFIYTDKVDAEPQLAIELYVLADLYALDRLKSQCESIVNRKLCLTNAPLLLSVADQYQASVLKRACIKYICHHFERITKSKEFTILNRDLIIEILQSR